MFLLHSTLTAAKLHLLLAPTISNALSPLNCKIFVANIVKEHRSNCHTTGLCSSKLHECRDGGELMYLKDESVKKSIGYLAHKIQKHDSLCPSTQASADNLLSTCSSVTTVSWLPSNSLKTIQVGRMQTTVKPKLIPIDTKWLALPSDCIAHATV